MPTGLKYVVKPYNIALYIRVWVFQGITHTGLQLLNLPQYPAGIPKSFHNGVLFRYVSLYKGKFRIGIKIC